MSSIKKECFDVTIKDNVAHLVLSRPQKRNSLPRSFWNDFPAVVEEIDEKALARVLVVSSTGPHFTAGIDLGMLQNVQSDADTSKGEKKPELGRRRGNFLKHLEVLQHTFTALEKARFPVLCAVQGGCIGAGVDMISAADIRYCTHDAFFCIQEINLGLMADVGTFPRMAHLLPQGLVRELAYTGQRMGAEEALAYGYVTRVFKSREDMEKEVLSIAEQIAQKSPLAIWGTKEMINYARDNSVDAGLRQVALWQSGMFHGGDTVESFSAQQEKRDSSFANLAPVKKTV